MSEQPSLFDRLDRIRRGKDTIAMAFLRFHEAHPDVYRELVAVCREWRVHGGGHWSVDAAYQVVRYQRQMASLPDPAEAFRLNDHYRSRYARLIMEQEPDLDGIFETRSLSA